MRTNTQIIVIGQGLAGTAVAWELHRRGMDFVVVDPGEFTGASHVAAGLVTPVAGKRFAVAAHFRTLQRIAAEHYQSNETALGQVFYDQSGAIRQCYTSDELELFNKRKRALEENNHIRLYDDTQLVGFKNPAVTFEMPQAAKLDTSGYLLHSRAFFERAGYLISDRVDNESISSTATQVEIPALALRADHIVYCCGYQDAENSQLPVEAFNSAKGEIIDIHVEGLGLSKTIHAFKSWLTPTATTDIYSFGSTYNHQVLDHSVTVSAREELEQRLSKWLTLPYTVVAHRAGIRPVGMQRQAIVGRQVSGPFAWLNGLGSKGVLLAPYLAAQLIESLQSGTPLDTSLTPTYAHDRS